MKNLLNENGLPPGQEKILFPMIDFLFVVRVKTLYMRISVDGLPTEYDFSLHLKVVRPKDKNNPQTGEWWAKAQCVKGNSSDAELINARLESIKDHIRQMAMKLVLERKPVTAEVLKELYLGKKQLEYTFLEVAENHLQYLAKLPDDEISKNTVIGYRSRTKNLAAFLKAKHLTKIQCHEFTPRIANLFLQYMRSERLNPVGQKHAAKNLELARKVIKFAINQEWCTFNPLQAFVIKKGTHQLPPYLEADERLRIETRVFDIKRLQQVKDSFVFMMYTGLSFSDATRLNTQDHIVRKDELFWLDMSRIKTGIDFYVPLSATAVMILQRYGWKKLPMCANQNFNAYLKEIQDLCRIQTKLTAKVARTTFGVVMLNDMAVPLETVSRMLGHASVKITEKHYAKVLKERMVRDVVNKSPELYHY